MKWNFPIPRWRRSRWRLDGPKGTDEDEKKAQNSICFRFPPSDFGRRFLSFDHDGRLFCCFFWFPFFVRSRWRQRPRPSRHESQWRSPRNEPMRNERNTDAEIERTKSKSQRHSLGICSIILFIKKKQANKSLKSNKNQWNTLDAGERKEWRGGSGRRESQSGDEFRPVCLGSLPSFTEFFFSFNYQYSCFHLHWLLPREVNRTRNAVRKKPGKTR